MLVYMFAIIGMCACGFQDLLQGKSITVTSEDYLYLAYKYFHCEEKATTSWHVSSKRG